MSVIIGLYGEAGAGKDQFALFASNWADDHRLICHRFSFAQPIYDLAAVIFGTTVEMLGERSQKEIPVWRTVTQTALESARDLWETYGLNDYADFAYVWPIFEEKYFGDRRTRPLHLIEGDEIYSILISAREILQLLGTELGRNMLHKEVWPRTLQKQLLIAGGEVNIITDVRFDNEAYFIHEIRGMKDSIIVEVSSPKSQFKIKTGHASESGISKNLINQTFHNTFEGLEKMKKDVYEFLDNSDTILYA